MEIRTHQRLAPDLCGQPVALSPGRAVVRLTAGPAMAVDDRGLVHGGFVFGLADYAAMLAVNTPTVVLAAADVRFLKPARVGDTLTAEAVLDPGEGRKRHALVTVSRDGEAVFSGRFTCVTLDRHVLDA